MGEVLPFTEEHTDAVAALYFRAMRGQKRLPSLALGQYFSHVLLRNPWASSEIPPLMYVSKGVVSGFLGVIPRSMEFRGQPIRVAVTSQLMVDEAERRGPAAMLLLRRLFQGPQDMCWTDGAADAVHHLWNACGGQAAPHYSFQWLRFLRPFSFGREILARKQNTALNTMTGLISGPADAVLTRLAGSALRPPEPTQQASEVSTEDLFSFFQQTGWKESLHPSYEAQSFSWLISEAANATTSGILRRLLIPAKDGWVGSAVYWAKPGGSAYILQIGARRRDQIGVCLDALFHDAWQQGCAVVRGYGVPAHYTPLTQRACIFRYPGSSALVQAKDPAIVQAVLEGDAALSRLDGECWLRFSSEKWA